MLINALRMPLPDSDERVVLMTVSDVTARKAAEQQILDLNRQLEGKVDQVSEVNRELEAFSYSVSHDLRAPLRHISGFADKLGRHLGERADEKSLHYLGVIGDSARRMSALIDDLLVYSRLGRSALRLQAVDMQSLVDDVRSMLESNLQQDAPAIAGSSGTSRRCRSWSRDENMMRQVWLNLLGNAVKYSAQPRPGPVSKSDHQPAAGRQPPVHRARQWRRLRHALRRQAVRRVPAPAPGQRVSRHRHRPGQRPPHPAPAWRPHLGRGGAGCRRHVPFHACQPRRSTNANHRSLPAALTRR